MDVFEKLGLFYLGKIVDPKNGELTDDYLLYDSKDLSTHAVCVGMTGSGKTGLCVGLLEEAVIDNIPSIIIDPKGDLGNLLLTFPDLKGKDFEPWINIDEARKKNLTAEEFAAKQADLWKNGLAKWGQDGERIRRLRKSTDLAIYTPGSSAGLSVSILNSFAAPSREIMEDRDLVRERVQTTTSGILELLGIKADPLQSREHILLSNIIENSWSAGKDLDLGNLIQMIQAPPMEKIGVFDLESFYPAKERFKLSMTLNNLLAAPGFQSWLEGEALDIDKMLYTDRGTPRTTIFSIAHLSDAERMFFVTLLLNQVLGWMRTQSGTTSLRALLYMDEVFGFLPPVGEPPSKKPLLTLLKQARAFGLGVILATQNPVDLDYKGLSNTGTWFIGRLQTARDKERLADGLSSAGGGGMSKSELMDLISNLDKRQFIMNSVHKENPVIFNTRWVMSYLRGPLTREHIRRLMKERGRVGSGQSAVGSGQSAVGSGQSAVGSGQSAVGSGQSDRPMLPPEIRQYHAPIEGAVPGDRVIYRPFVIAGGDLQIASAKYSLIRTEQMAHLLPLSDREAGLSWDAARAITFRPGLLSGEAGSEAVYAPLAGNISRTSVYNALDKQYETFVYRTFRLTLLKSPSLNQISQPGESERDFRIRLAQASHERRDLEVDRLKRSYSKKFDSLDRQIQTQELRIDKESDQYDQKRMDTVISVGTTILGAIFGGKASRTSVSRSTRSATRMSKEKQDIRRAQEKLEELAERKQKLEADLQTEIDLLVEKLDISLEKLDDVAIRPKKSDILQRFFGILWVPFRSDADGNVQALNKACSA